MKEIWLIFGIGVGVIIFIALYFQWTKWRSRGTHEKIKIDEPDLNLVKREDLIGKISENDTQGEEERLKQDSSTRAS